MQASRPHTSSWVCSSHVTVFLRNLRLLQLDQLPDWPGLSARLFSGGQQALRQRVKGIEWALYHLFAIWDPERAKNKLRPFFPPLEPLQSVNLRGALFRCLSDLKKNGDLGREAIVRKSMLDDCKGPKFEEVLAIFSTAVLRKLALEVVETPGLRMALAKSFTPDELETLVPLILVYQSSLGIMSQRKARLRSTHDRFSRLLVEKSEELNNRSKNKLPPLEKLIGSETLIQEVKGNWFGSEAWAQTLLYGGSRSGAGGFLELPFEQIWSQANKDTIDDLTRPAATDLLLDLERRLSEQRGRLRRWQQFRESMKEDEDIESKNTQEDGLKNEGLVFREHQMLTVASISKAMRQSTAAPRVLNERHEAILSSMKAALAKVKGEATRKARPLPQPYVRSRVDRAESKQRVTGLSPIPDEDYYARAPSPNITITTPEYEPPHFLPETNTLDVSPPNPSPTAESHDASSPSDNGILDPPQSLSFEPDLLPLPKPQVKSYTSNLIERTRKSMSLLPPQSTSRSRQSAAFRRPPRQSQNFPINQFQTPPRQQQASPPSRSGATTPRDELFSEEADYASVFKSRPRVATSPLFSPAVIVGLGHESNGDDGGDDDYDDGDSVSDLGMDSPLAGVRTR